MNKCIGIISYLPDDPVKRKNRRDSFLCLLKQLDTYFKLPIVIIAQNWTTCDLNLNYSSNEIKVYMYRKPLGITRARAELRNKLLLEQADYFIFLDDDTNITTITEEGVKIYLNEIDSHPDMVGEFNGAWLRLYAMSRTMLQKMSWDFLLNKNLDATRGEVWEDITYALACRRLYPSKIFRFSKKGLDETFIASERDPNSTWYKNNYDQRAIGIRSRLLAKEWPR